MNITKRASVVAVVTAAATLAAGGLAYAYWATTGTGTGTAASGGVLPLTLTPGTLGTSVLYPSASADVVITVSNPNPFPVSLDSLTLPASAATAYSNSGLTSLNAACNAAGTGVTWAYTSKALSGVIVAKKTATNGLLTLTLTNGATMSNSSDTTCASSFFKMPDVLTAPGSSSTGTPVASISQ